MCENETCSDGDIDRCCETRQTCAMFDCDTDGPGFTLVDNPETHLCRKAQCIATDKDECCQPTADCSAFYTSPGCAEDFEPKPDTDTYYCHGVTCQTETPNRFDEQSDNQRCCQLSGSFLERANHSAHTRGGSEVKHPEKAANGSPASAHIVQTLPAGGLIQIKDDAKETLTQTHKGNSISKEPEDPEKPPRPENEDVKVKLSDAEKPTEVSNADSELTLSDEGEPLKVELSNSELKSSDAKAPVKADNSNSIADAETPPIAENSNSWVKLSDAPEPAKAESPESELKLSDAQEPAKAKDDLVVRELRSDAETPEAKGLDESAPASAVSKIWSATKNMLGLADEEAGLSKDFKKDGPRQIRREPAGDDGIEMPKHSRATHCGGEGVSQIFVFVGMIAAWTALS